MNFRPMLVASFLLPAAASFAAPGDPCTADTDSVCNGTSVEFCNAENVIEAFDCAQLGGASCGDVECSGPSAECADGVLFQDCVADVGQQCIGASLLVDEDTTNDDGAFSFRCAGDATCVTGPNAAGDGFADVCVARLGDACEVDTEPACVGDVLVFCRRFIENEGDTEASIAQSSGVGLDCGALGGTCNPTATAEGPDCEFPEPAEGEGEGEGSGGDDDDDGGNGRDDEPEPAPGGCSATAGLAPVFGAALLALLAVRRRRA
jgi:uncharacterized protein (TIGR03382 family)